MGRCAVQHDRGRRSALREDEPPPRWRLAVVVGAWLLVAVLAFGFLAARAAWRAASVEEALDDRAATLRQEIADARDAGRRKEDLRSELASLQAELAELRRLVPCEMEIDALVPELRARLEPLGVQVRSDMGFKQRRELIEEARIPIVLPARASAEDEARRALQGVTRLLRIQPYGTDGDARVVVAYAGPRCETRPPAPPAHREPIPERDGLRWPFDRGVVAKEKELEALRSERDAVDGLDELLRRDRARWDIRALRGVIAEIRASQGVVAPAR